MERPAPTRRSGMGKLMLMRLAFLIPILVAVFVLHASGTALVIMHIARIAVVALVALLGGWLRTRRSRAANHPET
jgi:hypothetical protein